MDTLNYIVVFVWSQYSNMSCQWVINNNNKTNVYTTVSSSYGSCHICIMWLKRVLVRYGKYATLSIYVHLSYNPKIS